MLESDYSIVFLKYIKKEYIIDYEKYSLMIILFEFDLTMIPVYKSYSRKFIYLMPMGNNWKWNIFDSFKYINQLLYECMLRLWCGANLSSTPRFVFAYCTGLLYKSVIDITPIFLIRTRIQHMKSLIKHLISTV